MNSPKEKELKQELAITEAALVELQKEMELTDDVLTILEKRDEDLYRIAFYADKFPEEMRLMGIGGSDKYAHYAGLSNSELLTQISSGMDRIKGRMYAQSLSFQELIQLAKSKEKMIACIPAIQPVRNADLKRAISGFGFRIDPIYKTRQMHTGMDFTANHGTEVYATGDGIIEEIESKQWGYGNCIIINHGFGYKTLYAHLSGFKIKKGQKVKRGDLIGLIGSTGKSTGPHLHYEVIKNGEKVNPIGYYHSDLTPQQYEQLLEMSKSSFKALD